MCVFRATMQCFVLSATASNFVHPHERTEKVLSVGATVITLHQGSAPRLTFTSDDGAVICCAQQPGSSGELSAQNRFGLQCSTPGGISVELTSDAQVSDHQIKLAHTHPLLCAEHCNVLKRLCCTHSFLQQLLCFFCAATDREL